jgi:hypothetical protein
MDLTSMQSTADTGDGELAAGTDVSGYIIESKIGEGGMGRVYGAHPRIGKRVAIKVLGPQFCRDASTVARFEQETPEHRPTLGVMRQWFASLPGGGQPPAPVAAPTGTRPRWLFIVIALAAVIAAVMSFIVVRAAMG